MKFCLQAGHDLVEVTVTRTDGRFVVVAGDAEHHVDAHKLEGNFYSLIVDGRSYEISVERNGSHYHVRHGASEEVIALADPASGGRDMKVGGDGPAQVVSVMPGKVVRLLVDEGDHVDEAQGLVVIEAMKMENEVGAPRAGRVAAINVEPGRTVEAGETLVVIE